MALWLLSRASGDFGTSPFFEQLSGESLLTRNYVCGVRGSKHNSASRNKFAVGGNGLNLHGAHEPTGGRVFYGASICPLQFGIAWPRTRRRLPVSRTRAIVQPSGSMWPFRFRAWSSPCVRTRRHGAEILPMDSLRYLVEAAHALSVKFKGSFAVPAFIK